MNVEEVKSSDFSSPPTLPSTCKTSLFYLLSLNIFWVMWGLDWVKIWVSGSEWKYKSQGPSANMSFRFRVKMRLLIRMLNWFSHLWIVVKHQYGVLVPPFNIIRWQTLNWKTHILPLDTDTMPLTRNDLKKRGSLIITKSPPFHQKKTSSNFGETPR